MCCGKWSYGHVLELSTATGCWCVLKKPEIRGSGWLAEEDDDEEEDKKNPMGTRYCYKYITRLLVRHQLGMVLSFAQGSTLKPHPNPNPHALAADTAVRRSATNRWRGFGRPWSLWLCVEQSLRCARCHNCCRGKTASESPELSPERWRPFTFRKNA